MNGFVKKVTALYIAVGLIILTGGLYLFPTTTEAICGNVYAYCQTITVNHTKVPSTQTNFTIVATTTQAVLKTSANGGHITKTVTFNGQTVPSDLVFASDASCSNLLNWEIASYSATTGQIEAWILISSLSSITDNLVYMCYGNTSITTYQGGAVGAAWNSDYKGVWHMPNGTSFSPRDSTTNAINGSQTGITATAGQIDGAGGFTSNSQTGGTNSRLSFVTGNTIEGTNNTLTQSVWLKRGSSSAIGKLYEGLVGNGNLSWYLGENTATVNQIEVISQVPFGAVTTTDFGSVPADTNWHLLTLVSNAGNLTLYIDAVSNATAVSQNYNFVASNGATTFSVNDNAQSLWGTVDEFRSSDLALSADWITTEYNNQSSVGTFITFGAEQARGSAVNVTIQSADVFIGKSDVIIPN